VTDDGTIRSTRNTRVVTAAALHDARTRRREGLHLAEGRRVCGEALSSGLVVELFHTAEHADLASTAPSGIRVAAVDERVMARLSDAATPPGIVAVVRTPASADGPSSGGALLVLDHVSDPGNVGTLIRSAAAFGVGVLSIAGADPFGPKAVRASAGMCYRTPVHRAERLTDVLASLRADGRPLLGLAAEGGLSLSEAADRVSAAGFVLLVGSEPSGLPTESRTTIDASVRIPMRPGVESLNVAAAGAIALHVLAGGAR